jgi:hypothetical protein
VNPGLLSEGSERDAPAEDAELRSAPGVSTFLTGFSLSDLPRRLRRPHTRYFRRFTVNSPRISAKLVSVRQECPNLRHKCPMFFGHFVMYLFVFIHIPASNVLLFKMFSCSFPRRTVPKALIRRHIRRKPKSFIAGESLSTLIPHSPPIVSRTPIPNAESRAPCPVSRVPCPVSRAPCPVSRVPCPESRVPSPVSRVPSPVLRGKQKTYTSISLFLGFVNKSMSLDYETYKASKMSTRRGGKERRAEASTTPRGWARPAQPHAEGVLWSLYIIERGVSEPRRGLN